MMAPSCSHLRGRLPHGVVLPIGLRQLHLGIDVYTTGVMFLNVNNLIFKSTHSVETTDYMQGG